MRYKSGIGNTLSELVILLTAREWSQDFEWSVHAPIAAKVGIKAETIAAIRDGRRPDALKSDEAIIYDFLGMKPTVENTRMYGANVEGQAV